MTQQNVYGEREKQRSKNVRGNGNGERNSRFSGVSQGKTGSYGRGQKTERPKQNYRYQNSFRSNDKDKEEEYDNKPRMSKPRRTEKNDELAKIKEQQPDKIIIMKKLEKEQKAMKKKSEEKKKAQSSRPMPKQKRSKNINYTRQYENGMYEDYEDWYESDF